MGGCIHSPCIEGSRTTLFSAQADRLDRDWRLNDAEAAQFDDNMGQAIPRVLLNADSFRNKHGNHSS